MTATPDTDNGAPRRVFLAGIGGIGMSALARYYLRRGCQVAGYDLRPTALTRALEAEGATVIHTDDPALIPAPMLAPGTLVVRTPAVADSLRVLAVWRRHGVEPLRRSQALAMATRGHHTLAVAGTHGKTTVTTLLAHLLNQRPGGVNAFMGGISRNYGTNVLASGDAREMVVEADEYDRAFLRLAPRWAAVTSIDADHLDIYSGLDDLRRAFAQFASQVDPAGLLLRRLDLPRFEGCPARQLTYHATDPAADHRARDVELAGGLYTFGLATPHGDIPGLRLGVPGLHNLENAVAASALALAAGLPADLLRRGLATFAGVERRFELRVNGPEAYVDDYAHHPAEIEACHASLRQAFPGRRVEAIFQPHLYSRTRDLEPEFARALSLFDHAVVTDIYPAREAPIEGVSGRRLAGLVPGAEYVPYGDIEAYARSRRFDVVATLGAGSIGELAPALQQTMEGRQ